MTGLQVIVGVDPGKKTGVAVWDIKTASFIAQWEADPPTYTDWVIGYLQQSQPGSVLVACERFVISGGTATMGRTDENWSIELIGWTRHAARRGAQVFVLQSVGDAKKFSSNDRLREAGWYPKGKGHAADATRHAILARANVLKEAPPWI